MDDIYKKKKELDNKGHLKPLANFFHHYDITHQDWEKFYSSHRAFYNRITQPNTMTLGEAIKICKELNITLDEFIAELKHLGVDLN